VHVVVKSQERAAKACGAGLRIV